MFLLLGCAATPKAVPHGESEIPNNWVVWIGKDAIDIRTGKVIWGIQTKEPLQGVSSQAAGPDVFLETQDRELQRRHLADGQILWSVPGFSAEDWKVRDGISFPTITLAGNVVVHAAPRRIKAHDRDSGKLLWSRPFEGDGSPELIVDGDRFFSAEAQTLCDLKTGAVVWKTDQPVVKAHFLPGGDLLAVIIGGMARLDRETGEVLWRIPIDSENTDSPAAYYAIPYVVIGSTADDANAWTAVYDARSGRQLWFGSHYHPVAATLSEDASTLYVGRWDHRQQENGVELLALDTRTWDARWRRRAQMDGITFGPWRERLLVAEFDTHSYDTRFYCLAPRTGALLWKAEVEGIAVAHSIYSQGADIDIRGPWAVLIDGQSAGCFVETFQMEDGKNVSRWMFKNE